MKNLFKVLLLATALMFSGPIINMAKANHAPIPAACAVTDSDFMATAAKKNTKMYRASEKFRTEFLNQINVERAKAKIWALEADDLMIGIFTQDGQLYVGVVFYKDHCVVPGTVKVFTGQMFIAGLTAMGFSMDDFTQITES